MDERECENKELTESIIKMKELAQTQMEDKESMVCTFSYYFHTNIWAYMIYNEIALLDFSYLNFTLCIVIVSERAYGNWGKS